MVAVWLPVFVVAAVVVAWRWRDERALVALVVAAVVLLHQLTGLPVPDLLFAVGVLTFAVSSASQTRHAELSQLPAPLGGSVHPSKDLGSLSFRQYAWRAHELGKMWASRDKRERVVAICVGGIVMLVMKLQSTEVPTTVVGDLSQLKGMVLGLIMAKLSKQWIKRLLVLGVWLTRGVAWMRLRDVLLGFALMIVLLLLRYAPYGVSWTSLLAQWLSQWAFGITIVELAWCYLRWRMWRRWSIMISWLSALADKVLGARLKHPFFSSNASFSSGEAGKAD
jgi:hypothetical protein